MLTIKYIAILNTVIIKIASLLVLITRINQLVVKTKVLPAHQLVRKSIFTAQ